MVKATIVVCCIGAVLGAERLKVVNGCESETIWIASSDNVPGGPIVKLAPGGSHAYDIPEGLSSTRFWPKMYCNDNGQMCKIGDSGGPGQECGEGGCAPPVDSKFEATFGDTSGDCHSDASKCDWWDTSGVDGFTLPYKVELSSDCKGEGYAGVDIDCSKLSLRDCPVEDMSAVGSTDLTLTYPDSNDVVGCYSPCAKLTTSNWQNPAGSHTPDDEIANPYCCPTPPVSSEQCRTGPADSSSYTQLIHKSCPHVYAYAYDDAVGLQVCPPTTVYTWTLFCPTAGRSVVI